jgi:hypothetical protein
VKNINDLPEEARQALIGSLLKSLGVGPIDSDDEDAPTIMISGADESDPSDAREALKGMLAHLVQKHTHPAKRPATLDEVLAFNKPHKPPLKVGDAVRWRPGQRNARFPDDGEVCIVSQIIEPPLRDGDTSNEAAAERNDVALALAEKCADGTVRVREFVYDSRRLERVETPAE